MDDFGYDFDYTTEWQEVEFTLSGQDEIVWEGLLRDIRLTFNLDRNEAGCRPGQRMRWSGALRSTGSS